MGDVNNIRGLFDEATLRKKQEILDRLTEAGAPNASYNWGDGQLIWVCPYYVEERDALELLDVLAQSKRTLHEMPIDELRKFEHTYRAQSALPSSHP
jgi:hypothetical protein